MLAEMSASHFAEWEDFFELEPYGSEIEALRSAQPAYALACIHRDPAKSAPELSDFAIGYKKPQTRTQSDDELANNLMEIFGVSKSLRPDGPTKG